jgi:ATP/maltotriose-dependent transcriptional regulator MalT
VLIEGSAGIGKTALVHRFLSEIEEHCVLRASGEETESRLAFGVLTQLVMHASTVPANPLTTLVGNDQRPVDALVAGAALVDLLGELQHHSPVVVLVLDDVHWADNPSLHALTFALRRLRGDRVLALVLTREETDPRLPEGLRRVLAGERGVRLRLAGLDVAELLALGARLGVGRLPRRSVERLYKHTGGNPLYARALLEEFDAEKLRDADAPLPAPRSFALFVLTRLAVSPPETQQLVTAASVLGLSCPLHLAAQLAELDDPWPALELAVVAGLLEERPIIGIPLVAFPHPLVHAAVYQALGPARRARLHAQAATLVDDGAARLEHRLRAASSPDPQLAGDVAAFARRHAASGLWDIAAEQLTRAVRLVSTVRDKERLTVEAVEALLLDGRVDEATALAAELPDSTDPAARGYILGRLAFTRGRLPQAQALLTEGWQHCDRSAEPALAARLAGQLAMLCLMRAHGADAAGWADRALELISEQTVTDMVRFTRLIGLGISGSIDQALALVMELPDPAVASLADMDGLLARGLLRTWTDDLPRAQQDLAGVVVDCKNRSMPFRLMATAMLGQNEYRLGRWDDAETNFNVAISTCEEANQSWLTPQTHGLAALVPSARGHWQRAAAHVGAAHASTPHTGHVIALVCTASGHAHLAAARGDAKEVVTVLRPLLALDSHDGTYAPAVPWQDLLVEAFVTLGEHEQAEAVLVPFETLAATRKRHSMMATAARARGILLAARHDSTGAAAAFQAGLDHAAQVAMPFDRARLELAYGAFLRRVGKRALAAEQLEAARAILEHLDARPYLERCERELAACECSPAARRRPSDSARLTVQELAVARLAVRGLTNRLIARELVVSVKTVEYHLGHVYAKLGVSSRVQLVQRLPQD